MPKLVIRMIFYTFSVCSWYFSYMKQALYCHTLVSIPDSLTADAINTHMFSDVSETTDILQYGKCDVFTYLSFFCKTILSDDQQSSRSMDWLMSIWIFTDDKFTTVISLQRPKAIHNLLSYESLRGAWNFMFVGLWTTRTQDISYPRELPNATFFPLTKFIQRKMIPLWFWQMFPKTHFFYLMQPIRNPFNLHKILLQS